MSFVVAKVIIKIVSANILVFFIAENLYFLTFGAVFITYFHVSTC